MGGFQEIHLFTGGLQSLVPLAERAAQFLCLEIQFIQIIPCLLQHEGCGDIVLLRLLGSGGQLLQGVQPHSYLHAPQLVLQFQVLLRLFGLHPQRLQLQLQFGDLIADAHQVILGTLQFALGLLLAVAVFGNTGSLLKDLPAVGTLQGQDLINTALANVGIAFLAKARIHKHFVDVPQAGRLLVDIVFRVTGAVIPAGDHYLVGIVWQCPVGIIQGQGGLRKTHGGPLLGAAEDHILHLGATERFAALLAHNPKDGIGNIRFAGTVGTDNGGDIVAKADQGLVREGFEALHFQALKIHSKTSF